MGCKARVWDNGDMTDCGERVLRHGFCAWHLKHKIDSLRVEKRALEAKLLEVVGQLDHLQSESG